VPAAPWRAGGPHRLEIRQAWRTLAAARKSYELQQEGLRLATRRVDSADLNLQAGKATTRDLLEAEQARVEARNALTAALVAFAVARLELERDAGILRPDETAAGRSAPAAKAAAVPAAPAVVPGPPPRPGIRPRIDLGHAARAGAAVLPRRPPPRRSEDRGGASGRPGRQPAPPREPARRPTHRHHAEARRRGA
jgi:hypothetical protein